MKRSASRQPVITWALSGLITNARVGLLAGVALALLRTACELAGVYLLSPLVTEIAAFAPTPLSDGFWSWLTSDDGTAARTRTLLLWIALAQAGLIVSAYLRPWLETHIRTRVMTRLRSALYDHLQHMAFSFYDETPSGELTARLLKDLESVSNFLRLSSVAIVEVVFAIVAFGALLAFRSLALFAAIICILPLWSWLLARFNARAQVLYRAQDTAYDAMLGHADEHLRGMATVRAFGRGPFVAEAFVDKVEAVQTRARAIVRFHAWFSPLFGGTAMLSHVALLLICALLIRENRLPVGDLVILGAAMSSLLTRLEQIGQIAGSYPPTVDALTRLHGILDIKRSVAAPDAAPVPFPKGDVRFENVRFGYRRDRPLFTDLNLVLPKGQVTALVGPTGSGKTSLALLLGRFYEPSSGRILIDGVNVNTLPLSLVRHRIGYVFQETFLFTASIRDNIRYGRLDVSEDMLVRAATVAHAHEFITGLPQGYDTPLGAEGVQLSGGQRQRLALARALVYDPSLLILDDATAALDASTDAIVRANLKHAFRGRTVLMITHKKTSLALCDHVLRLSKGRIEALTARAATHAPLELG